MPGEISSNSVTAEGVAAYLKRGLSGYLGFSLKTTSEYAPVNGNSTHDSLGGAVSDALSTWKDLVDSDASAVVSIASSIEGADSQEAARMLGVDHQPPKPHQVIE